MTLVFATAGFAANHHEAKKLPQKPLVTKISPEKLVCGKKVTLTGERLNGVTKVRLAKGKKTHDLAVSDAGKTSLTFVLPEIRDTWQLEMCGQPATGFISDDSDDVGCVRPDGPSTITIVCKTSHL